MLLEFIIVENRVHCQIGMFFEDAMCFFLRIMNTFRGYFVGSTHPSSNSHHQDEYIFRIGDPELKPSFTTVPEG